MSYRRRLAAIERALIADEPVLSSKFAVFNQLTDGQRPVGLEPVPRAFRPRPTYLAVILVLTAIAALFLTISPGFPR